jgi:hypothetical protein
VTEAEVDQPFEVDDRCSGGERDAVPVDASVAAAAVAVGDKPGDGALDHRPVLAIVVDEVGVGSPTVPVRGEVLVVFCDEERLAVDR